jgi:hypothetical protein
VSDQKPKAMPMVAALDAQRRRGDGPAVVIDQKGKGARGRGATILSVLVFLLASAGAGGVAAWFLR